MTDTRATIDRRSLHELKNHLGAILGVVELLLADTPADDPRHADLQSVETAAKAAIALLPRLDVQDLFGRSVDPEAAR